MLATTANMAGLLQKKPPHRPEKQVKLCRTQPCEVVPDYHSINYRLYANAVLPRAAFSPLVQKLVAFKKPR